MFDYIGEKIKKFAEISVGIAIFAYFVLGIILMSALEDLWYIGLFVMILGPVAAWISSLFFYGFGELIEKTCQIERNTRGEVKKSHTEVKEVSSRIKMIEELRASGVITEEEYKTAMSKGM